MKKETKKEVKKVDIHRLIDELGDINREINHLEKRAEELKNQLKPLMELGTEYYGERYKAVKTEKTTPILDPKAVSKHVKPNVFMDIISVSVTAARKVMLEETMDKCVKEYKVIEVVSVKPKENGNG